MSPKLDGNLIPMWESIEVKEGQVLELAFAIIGARSYIAFSGGITNETWLNSRSTFHKAGVGGIEGKAIQEGQILPLGRSKSVAGRKIKKSSIPSMPENKKWSIEVIKGPNDDWVNEKGHKMFLDTEWKLQAKSDRTGYRLDGPEWSFTDKATNKEMSSTFKTMERRLYLFIMTPAAILTWLTGISLIHYFGLETWLILKMLFVLGLSIFHFYCGKWMKLFAKDLNVNSAKFFRIYNEVPTVLMIFIVIFVVFKPFL